VKIDFGRVMERVREIRAEISINDSVHKLAKKYGVDVFLGNAQFINQEEIDINGKSIQFSKCCIATGGHPFIPDVEGLKEFPYLTSENVFNITEKPKTLVIIGSGPIGCELGQSFARFGTRVIMLERSNQFLSNEDPDAAAYLHQQMKDDGVEIFFKTKPLKVVTKKSPGKVWSPDAKFELEVDHNGKTEIIKGDAILVATGRRPNVHGMGLEEAGVEFNDITGIKVDDYCKTSNKKIYAVGDVCSPYKFTHNADHMARNAVRNALLFGKERTSNLIMSWSTFTDPEIAHVGKYPRDLEKEGIEYDTYKYDMAHNDRAICDSVVGMVKIHCKKGTDKILGSTIVGGPSGDMI
jgi:pyruvate/2-oxoglutarate dehydrogenase complex dihydrolipoamide dehydrogenase (E3) component